ncbi:sigma factor-like helix-turn-helix DNA-binding protein [Micromonospora sp. NPDC023737]|uniref:sigma factor-like helix-turn-helix DNA-binding protein n=1 Tax=unclassified Micromonospora TaxID=2617518 RepID=UPI0033C3B62F
MRTSAAALPHPASAALADRERTLRFYGNLTQAQIAERVGVSRMHVPCLITKALAGLHGRLAVDAAGTSHVSFCSICLLCPVLT